MNTSDFTATLLVDQTLKEAFDAINNVRGWWGKGVEGGTDKLDDEFIYRHEDIHYSKQKLIEIIPNKRVVWLVTEGHLNFVKDKGEWIGTKISFDISEVGEKTQILFRHIGLKPEVECFDACSGGWNYYLKQSLLPLITTGKGNPDKKEIAQSKAVNHDFTTTILVNQSPKDAFDAIKNVRAWWSEEIEGNTNKLNDEWTYHYKNVHRCKMKIVEMIPDQKVVWLVLDNYFNFIKDQSEWKGTKIIFEISRKENQTRIRFTHLGLVPEYECYDVCHDAWSGYIKNSLKNLIVTGKGQPNPKEDKITA